MVWTNISPEKCFTNKHKKRCLLFLNMREMQIKTTMRYNYITIKMTLKKNENTNYSSEQWNFSNIGDRNEKWHSILGKQLSTY